ncbi:hypothetical protein [Pontibacter sp. G13]|uniref:hypothetical protein n=1 Tax=Pontibacter sp. G13 TaxID=3074898 RepID=UPI00288A69FF|nr:hypothetical protein [Pontibacter sp. G13]WNJ20938.1 hypothetical protein RJD25_10710 [Pontibacter sp. G13]
MNNASINRIATIKVAKALGHLCEEVIFVGGATVSLYIDDPAAEDIRPTKDIDLAFHIITVGELEQLRSDLNQRGFREAVEGKVICRFHLEELLVDVMSTQEVGWAPGNRWFLAGFDSALAVKLDEVRISILPLPFFLAAKLDAFFDRGMEDVYASTDLEDIVYLLIHTSNAIHQIQQTTEEVRAYLKESAHNILKNRSIMNAIPGHLSYDNPDEQLASIKHILSRIAHI